MSLDAPPAAAPEAAVSSVAEPSRRRPRGRAIAGMVGLLAVTGVFVAGVVGGEGDRAGVLDLGAGTAWFGAASSGTVALIDGSTATRVARVRAAQPGDAFAVVQSGSAALVVDTTSGTVRRIDGASWGVGEPVKIGTPGEATLAVYTGGDSAWAVLQNATVVQQIDPVLLSSVGAPQTVPGTISGIAVGPDGTLWVTNATGELRSYRNGAQRSATKIDGLTDATVILAGTEPVVVDVSRHVARLVDPVTGEPTRDLCFDVADSPAPEIASGTARSPWLLAVAPNAATLLVSHTDTSNCQPIVLGDTSSTPRYGQPVEKDGLVYVPDFQAGTVIVVDPELAAGQQIIRRVDIGLPKSTVDLLVHNQFVWFDEPGGDRAGVIGDDLVARSVSKTDGSVNGEVPQSPDTTNPDPGRPSAISCSHQPVVAPPGAPVTFNAFATDPGTQVDNWEWTFEGGQPADGQGPQASSSFGEGNHNVTVNATIAGAQVSTACPVLVSNNPPPTNPTITVPNTNPNTNPNTKPTTTTTPGGGGGGGGAVTATFSMSPNPGKVGTPVTFTNTTKGNPPVAKWEFTGGLPATATTATATSTWNAPGRYRITLTVNTSAGAKSAQQDLVINPPDQATVPDVSRKTVAQATTAITGAGLKVGTTTTRDSLVANGSVVVTNPVAGASVAVGSAVDLVISNGVGSVSLIAGDGNSGTSGMPNGDGGPAVNAQLIYPRAAGADLVGNVYFFEEGNCRIRRVDPFGGISTIAGSAGCQTVDVTSAAMPGPAAGKPIEDLQDLAVDPAGNVYTLESASAITNSFVRRIGTDGQISTYITGFNALGGAEPHLEIDALAVSPNGSLYLAGGQTATWGDPAPTTQVFVRVNAGGGTGVVVGQPGLTLHHTTTIGVNQAGDIAFHSWYDGVRLFTASDGTVKTVVAGGVGAGSGDEGDGGPGTAAKTNCQNVGCDFAFDASGGLLIADSGNNRVRRVDLTSGIITAFAGNGVGNSGNGGPAPAAKFDFPQDIAVAPDGSVIVSDSANHQIRRVS